MFVGLAEIFDYKVRKKQITIGFCLNENYWHRGIATEATRLMVNYLCNDLGLNTLKGYAMPENVFSTKVLLRNGFVKKIKTAQGKN
jgi:ribosomal-protein-alanine N-acetyltransferase